jgi:hypothetical protein
MLIEGFDLPSLRILAYHDKHKSLPATAQIIGRLARVDELYPQPSVLVAARDIDVFPELQGVVRDLYGEDPDWASILPGIIDDEVAADLANRNYTRQFGDAPPTCPWTPCAPAQGGHLRVDRTHVDGSEGLRRRCSSRRAHSGEDTTRQEHPVFEP